MPRRTDLKKIMVIGSGPIVIGQAAEFDYAGTQACLALREEGFEVVLVNSNPATIMTDTTVADKVYMEPLTLEYVARIVRIERPDALLPGIGGQTGLNLARELDRKGVLAECGVELLGTSAESIERAEDRELFKELCLSLGEPVLPSEVVSTRVAAKEVAQRIGFPVVLRPAFTLGGTGGGFAETPEELELLIDSALSLSPVGQVLVEKSVKGYKEIEFEVMRDAADTAIAVCSMENIDPVGVHTGDSIVCAPTQTLANREFQMLRASALRIVRELGIEGGCNVQYALDPTSFSYYVIEVNPRVSRSSALASKASGYPIARVSAKVGVGYTLDEIELANTCAAFEPALDYVVTKIARFPFDKYAEDDNVLGTQMKATGEVMGVGRTFEESLLKSVRSLEVGVDSLRMDKFCEWSAQDLRFYIHHPTDDRIFAIAQLLRLGVSVDEIADITRIDAFFLGKVAHIVDMEERLANHSHDIEILREAKRMGFCDAQIARAWNVDTDEVRDLRVRAGIAPVYKMIDTCASEFASYVPYFYSTYEQENESVVTDARKVVVLGSGPIRIGQGVEFDFSTVHAVRALHKIGVEAIVINNNPETVSTDYTCADKLYFEPLTPEDVLNVVDIERPLGVIASLGGQTAVNLAQALSDRGVALLGTGSDAIERAENRDAFDEVLADLGIPRPEGRAVTSVAQGVQAASEIGYPVLVRPSFVLGGRAMQIVAKERDLSTYLAAAFAIDADKPVLVDRYIRGKEVEVDAVCDGERVFVPGVMELVERTGVHSGDSISIFPPPSLSPRVRETIVSYTEKLGRGLGIVGLFNVQFIVDEHDGVYIIEVNPRASRTVPFLSKATGVALVEIAVRAMLGESISDQGYRETCLPEPARYYVKAPAFSFSKLLGMDAYLSPEMKSTGEAIGIDEKLHRALHKALVASGVRLLNYGTVIFTLADEDKLEALPLARRFAQLGFNIEATVGTAEFFSTHGVRARVLRKLSEGSGEILDAIRAGYVSYVVNTRAVLSGVHYEDGAAIRRCASRNGTTMLTSLDTVAVLLDVLEEITFSVAPLAAG